MVSPRTEEYARFCEQVGALQRRVESYMVSTQGSRQELEVGTALQELATAAEELKVAEEELREQNQALLESRRELESARERYHALFDLTPDACLVTDRHGVILEANEAAGALLGRAPNHLLEQPLSQFVADGEALLQQLRAAGQGAIDGVTMDIRPTGGGGHAVPAEARVRPGQHRGTPILRWSLRDITERRDAQRALEQANRELEGRIAERTAALSEANEALVDEARRSEDLVAELTASERRLMEQQKELARSNQDLQDFGYVASHDLREPLRGIGNYATFLLEDAGPRLQPEDREKLDVIVRLSRRLHDLLESLLDYSRAGRLRLEVETLNPAEVLRQVADSLGPWLEGERAQIAAAGAMPPVRADRHRLAQVLSNLVVNAVKYNTSERKLVEIEPCEGAPAGFVRLCVRDNGIGIEPRHAEAVFGMFRRLHPRDRFGGGTGAGLAIVRKIVERHGGKVWLESEPGRGTTFYLELPAAAG